jgi:hypothetical protein
VAIPYPSGLPTVLASKRVSKGAAFSIASPRRGTPYVEPTGTDTPTVFAVEWLLSEADAAALVDWVQTTLERGTLEFTIPLRTETGLREITGNFLPDGLLDRQRDGTLWRYSASIVSRTGTGPLIVPAPPPPAPAPPPPSPAGYYISDYLGSVVFTAGESGGNVTTALQAAADKAREKGYVLDLPPWHIHWASWLACNKIRGVPGKTKLVPLAPFDRTGSFGNQFFITNEHFSQVFTSSADEVLWEGFDLELTPISGSSLMGLANVKSGLVRRLHLTALRNVVSGRPVAVDSLIDVYAAVKGLKGERLKLRNITGAYGLTKISEFGGSCFWIRNLSADGADPVNVTEGVVFEDLDLEHSTSDEAFAIYGVRGTTRNCHVRNFRLKAYSIDGVYRTTLASIFPLNDGSAGGANAAVYENSIEGGRIEDSGSLYTQIRIGNDGADANNPCYNNRSKGNTARAIRSTNPTTGQQAVWLAITGGTDASYPNPEVASSVFRCVDGNFGTAYFRDTSGNTSTDDVAINDGGTAGAGFQGFQRVTNPESLGDLFSGIRNCRFVFGGKVEAAAYAFFNVRSVVGTNFRQNLAGGAVFYLDIGIGGVYGMKDTLGESFGKLCEVTGAAPSNLLVSLVGNDVQMSGAASSNPILRNESSSGAKIKARNNTTRGANSSVTAGAGAIDTADNDWNGTTD